MGFEMKRGQVTLFIIIAVVVVFGIGITIFVLDDLNFVSLKTDSPVEFLDKCMSDALEEDVNLLISRNGYFEDKENVINYAGEDVVYSCFASEFYAPCVPQDVNSFGRVESELKERLGPKFESCFDELEKDLNKKGFFVTRTDGTVSLDFKESFIEAGYGGDLVFEKEGTSERFDGFDVRVSTKLSKGFSTS